MNNMTNEQTQSGPVQFKFVKDMKMGDGTPYKLYEGDFKKFKIALCIAKKKVKDGTEKMIGRVVLAYKDEVINVTNKQTGYDWTVVKGSSDPKLKAMIREAEQLGKLKVQYDSAPPMQSRKIYEQGTPEGESKFELDSFVYVDIEEFIVTINLMPHGEGTCDFRIKLSENGELRHVEIGINDSDVPDDVMLAEFHKYYKAGKFKNFPIHMTWDMETGECGTDQ